MSAKVKRSLPRRLLRGVGFTLGGLLTLVALVLAFLHTPWGKSFLRGRIESKLAARVNGELRIGSLDYSFMFGSIEIGKIEIRDASGQRALAIDTLSVDLDRSSLFAGSPLLEEVVIGGLEVAIVKTTDGGSNLKGLFKPSKGSSSLKHITVAHLAVSGGATLRKPDGTLIDISDIRIAGSIEAQPLAKILDAKLADLGAHVAIRKPNASPRDLAVSLGSIVVGRRPESIDVGIKDVVVGPMTVGLVEAHVGLANGKLAGDQRVTLTGAKIDAKQLAELLGKELLAHDVTLDMKVSGPAETLAIGGTVKTGAASLVLSGNVDRTAARPAFRLSLVGDKLHSKLVKSRESKLALAETDVRIELAGTGSALRDLDAALSIDVGPTRIGKIGVDGLEVKANVKAGAYQLERLVARVPGIEATVRAVVGADKAIDGRVDIVGNPAKLVKALVADGVAIKLPPRLKGALPSKLAIGIDLAGNINGALDVDLDPTRIAIAGGTVSLRGGAKLQAKKLQTAIAHIDLANLDLAQLAQLAGRPAKLHGKLDGGIDFTRAGLSKLAAFDLTISPRGVPVAISAKGSTDILSSATAKVTARRIGDKTVLATLDAAVPLTKRTGKLGLRPDGKLRVDLDIAQRSLAEIRELLPERLRAKIPAGDVEVHVDLAGTPARPSGTITLASSIAKNKLTPTVDVTTTISSSDKGLTLATTGAITLRAHGRFATASPGFAGPRSDAQHRVATIDATITTPGPFASGKLDVKAMRAGAIVDGDIVISERELASLAFLKPKLAAIDGSLSGTIHVAGPLKVPALDADLRWRGYKLSTGALGETTISADGTPQAFDVRILHAGGLSITAAVKRGDKIEVRAKTSADTAVMPLLPAFAAGKLPKGSSLGTLRTDLAGDLTLVKTPAGIVVEAAALTGALDLSGASLAIPKTDRRWRDVGLTVAAEANGIRIKALTLRESDVEKTDRKVQVSGFLALDKLKPQKLSLSLSAKDWLLFGSPLLGSPDAPRAAADFAIAADVDFTGPILAVDATVHSLELLNPDRLDRGHQQELASPAGDIIYLSPTSTRIGKLPVAPVVVVAMPKKKRPMDIRVHIPNAIHLVNAPLDLHATGDITIAVRQDATTIRGGLTMSKGNLNLFGRDHALVAGSLMFSEAHPKGNMALTFERRLSNATLRGMSKVSAGTSSRVTFAGSPTKPKITLGGATNAALAEVMATHNAGRPVHAGRPGLPASTTVQTLRADQLQILTFMASNLQHLLFLDRIAAWANPYDAPDAYGRIQHVEAERTTGARRVRVVARPNTPGRSSAEVQVDRILVDDDRKALGVGVRAGSRLGGGVGFFVEWSSAD